MNLASASTPDSPLLRREVFCARPPPSSRENLVSGTDYRRDRRFGAQPRLGWNGVLWRRQERFARKLREGLLEPRSRADNGRFHNVFASPVAALERKDSAKVIGISCRDALSA